MANRPGALVFDPTVTAVTLAETKPAGAGGGLVGGAGTYYSAPTNIEGYACVVTDDIKVVSASGPLTGTITVEVSNGSDEMDLAGTAHWQTYTKISSIAVAGSAPIGIEFKFIGWNRMRLKFVVTSGTGTIEDRRKTVCF